MAHSWNPIASSFRMYIPDTFCLFCEPHRLEGLWEKRGDQHWAQVPSTNGKFLIFSLWKLVGCIRTWKDMRLTVHSRNQTKVASAVLEKTWSGPKALVWELRSLDHLHHLSDILGIHRTWQIEWANMVICLSLLKYSWFTIFCEFQVYWFSISDSGKWFSFIYKFFFRFFSIIGYYKILDTVPCAIWQRTSLRWLSGKESACQSRRYKSGPWSGRSPEEGNSNPLQYSCLRIPWIEEPGGLQSRHNLETKITTAVQ